MSRASGLVPRLPGAVVALGVLLAVGEAWWLLHWIETAGTSRRRLKNCRHELGELAALAPPLTARMADTREAELERSRRLFRRLSAELRGSDDWRACVSENSDSMTRSEAYFGLVSFVERMEQRAREQGVEVRPSAARFGFSAYVTEAPAEPLLKSVHMQRLVAERRLGWLF